MRERIVPDAVTDFSDREKMPRSIRWSKRLAKSVEGIAAETGHDFGTTTLYLVDWALEMWREQVSAERERVVREEKQHAATVLKQDVAAQQPAELAEVES